MDPFEAARDVAGLWGRSGEAYLKAQTDLLSGMASWLRDGAARPDPEPADSASRPADPPGRGPPDADAARRAFERTWTTAREVAATALAHLHERSVTPDEASRTALAGIFDPAAWLEGLEAAGPAAAPAGPDPGAEAVLEAWAVLRRRNLEQATVVLEGWMQAAGTFARELSRDGAQAVSPDGLAERWAACAELALAETRRSERFDVAQRAVLAAAGELEGAQAAFGRHQAELYGSASRAELDALGKSVAALRREVRALQREVRLAGAAGRPAAAGREPRGR